MCKPVSPTVSKGLLRDCENRWIVCSSSRECDVSRPAADDRSRWAQSETAHSHSRAAQQISDNCCLVHRRPGVTAIVSGFGVSSAVYSTHLRPLAAVTACGHTRAGAGAHSAVLSRCSVPGLLCYSASNTSSR